MLEQVKTVCWTLGITEQQESTLHNYLGNSVLLLPLNANLIASLGIEQKEPPLLLFTSAYGEKTLNGFSSEVRSALQAIPRVLLLEENYSVEVINEALEGDVDKILKPEFTKKNLWNVILQAYENRSKSKDIHCLVKEITLGRELLDKKSEALEFLTSFLKSLAVEDDMTVILSNIYDSMQKLLPVGSLHGAFWSVNAENRAEVQLFLNETSDTSAQKALIEQCRKILRPGMLYEITDVKKLLYTQKNEDKKNELTLVLPVADAKEKHGVLLLTTSQQKHLGREQTEALMLTLHHLAVAYTKIMHLKQARLEADIDMLTGLSNRRHFNQRFEEEVNRAKRYGDPLGVMLIDIDYFKKVNDTYGHQAGDKVIQGISAIIKKQLRLTDFCARVGGEEFCILLPSTSKERTAQVGERIRQAIEMDHFQIGMNRSVRSTISIGIANLKKNDRKTQEELMKEADFCLYHAKMNGRNRLCDDYTPTLLSAM